jgi:hypothetical protein
MTSFLSEAGLRWALERLKPWAAPAVLKRPKRRIFGFLGFKERGVNLATPKRVTGAEFVEFVERFLIVAEDEETTWAFNPVSWEYNVASSTKRTTTYGRGTLWTRRKELCEKKVLVEVEKNDFMFRQSEYLGVIAAEWKGEKIPGYPLAMFMLRRPTSSKIDATRVHTIEDFRSLFLDAFHITDEERDTLFDFSQAPDSSALGPQELSVEQVSTLLETYAGPPHTEESDPVGDSVAGGDALVAVGGDLRELVDSFHDDCEAHGLSVSGHSAHRVAASLLSKRFLIITGLAGSGKTKLALAFARWITADVAVSDAFEPGSKIESDRVTYVVNQSDSLAVEFWNSEQEDAVRVMLPRAMIDEWAKYMDDNGLSRNTPARDIREAVKRESKYSDQLHSFETHLKAAALAQIRARKKAAVGKCYELVSVGADWTGNENILGYPNGLDREDYLAKPALNLALQAAAYPEVPHFLILDEMNLSHVERYFADILSAIESEEPIPLHEDGERKAGARRIPPRLELPKNLFIIGTVNVDETTYMFSPKVLDRANVIEFRMDADELGAFLKNPAKPDLAKLDGRGTGFGPAFALASRTRADMPEEMKLACEQEMTLFFRALQEHGAEFGYRVAHEVVRFVHFYEAISHYVEGDTSWFSEAFDCVIVQKLLPKLHGSRAKLGPLLKKLWFLCVNDSRARGSEPLKAAAEAARSTDRKAEPSTAPESLAAAHYPLSAEKIGRMWRLLNENGFASFAEA